MSEALSPAVSCLSGHRAFPTHEGNNSPSDPNHLNVPIPVAPKTLPHHHARTSAPTVVSTSGSTAVGVAKGGPKPCVICSVDCSPHCEGNRNNSDTQQLIRIESTDQQPRLLHVPNQDNFSSESFVVSLPRGAYTTARTFGGPHRVLEFDMHVERLVSSLCLMQQSCEADGQDESNHHRLQQIPTQCAVPNVAQVKAACIELLRFGLPHLQAAYAERGIGDLDEARVTALLHFGGPTDLTDPTAHERCPEAGRCTLVMYLEKMASLPTPPIKVQVRGAPRHNAEAKDSQWVVDRQSLARSAAQGVNEVLLVEGPLVEEGLSSNFFAVEADGSITTADSGVLKGTIRSIAIAQAEAHGVRVNLRPPDLRDAGGWQSAFLTSTSRLVLPVDEMEVFAQAADSAPVERYAFTRHDVVERLRAWVAVGAAQHVTDINGVRDM